MSSTPHGITHAAVLNRARYESMSDVVLYDVFFETGTQLGGHLVALEDAAPTPAEADTWHARQVALQAQRRSVDARDREAQIATLLEWLHELDTLPVI